MKWSHPDVHGLEIKSKMNNFYFARIFYVLIAWFVMGPVIIQSNSKSSLIAPLLLFLIPFCFDYYNPLRASKKNSARCNLIFKILLATIAILIMFLISDFKVINNYLATQDYLKYLLWFLTLPLFGVAIIDFVSMNTPEEVELQNKIVQAHEDVIQKRKLPPNGVRIGKGSKKDRKRGRWLIWIYS